MTPGEIMDRLATLYGEPVATPSGDGVAELILTILSQNTADVNSGRAFVSMMRAHPSWDAIADADIEELIATIQPGGLARQKAPRIQAVLREIRAREDGWNLQWLASIPPAEAKAWLRSLPGVGPKTAACVLLFALGVPALPVDTHVERVSKRLDLIPESATADQAHDLLEAMLPADQFYRFHMLFIKHGRRTCLARNPACTRCPLMDSCPWFLRSVAAKEASAG